jgi:NAD(P)-dependent dehydrogenase (short-subunit alcohol dehydrogenase family)
MNRYTGKVALVTGATRGIGAETARRLASEGARVAICGRSRDDGEAVIQSLGGADHGIYIQANLMNPADCANVIDTTVAAFGRLDVIVNNAASVARGTIDSTTVEEFDSIMALNVRAPFLLVQRAMPTFRAQYEAEGIGGAVINIGSINGYVGGRILMAYSASKGALMTLSKNLANALSPWHVRVHILNVGWTLTEGELVVKRLEGAAEDWVEQAGTTRPWRRLLKPQEIAAAVAFLGSPEAAVFSGATLDLEQFPIGKLD